METNPRKARTRQFGKREELCGLLCGLNGLTQAVGSPGAWYWEVGEGGSQARAG